MQRFIEFIRLSGPIWKPALAAGLAWTLAVPTGTHRPYFAPLAAILCMQVTVEESVWRGYQRVVGIVGGIVIADAATTYLGVHGWSMALLVLAGTALATWLKLGPQAVPQVGVSAIMVMVLGTGHQDYALDRIAETMIGVVTAVVVNMLVVPPDFTGQAEEAIQSSAVQLARHLRQQADTTATFDSHSPRQHLELNHPQLSDLHRARQAVQTGLQALRFSPLVRHRRARLIELEHDMRMLSEAYEHIVVLDEMLNVCHDNPLWSLAERQEWSGRLMEIASLIERWATTATSSHGNQTTPPHVQPVRDFEAAAALEASYRQLVKQFARERTRKSLWYN